MCEIKCKFCGKECHSNLSKSCHERFCKLNPNYESTIAITKQAVRKSMGKRICTCKEKNASNPLNQIQEYKLICQKCGKEYYLMLRKRDFENGKYVKCCSNFCRHSRNHSDEVKKKISKSLKDTYQEIYGNELSKNRSDYLKNPRRCKKCGNIIPFERKKRIFCSNECYQAYHSKNEVVKKNNDISLKTLSKVSRLKQNRIDYEKHPNVCLACGKPLPFERKHYKSCSKECWHKLQSEGGKIGGKLSASIRVKRSKNEIEFANLCMKEFPNCQISTNEPFFNGWDADIILKDYKVAVLWNGIWHYKKVRQKQSLSQIQSRDKIKLEEIKKCGYIPYVIQDMGSHNSNKVKIEFEKFKIFLVSNQLLRDLT